MNRAESSWIPLVRHLEDIDAIKTYGTSDAPVKPDQERVIDDLCQKIRQNLVSTTAIITSPCRRAVETAEAIKIVLEDNASSIDIITDPRIAELGKGILNLPENYRDGDFFGPLSKAWDVFWKRALEEGDLGYRFGDSVAEKSLEGHFSQFGENYYSYASRLYSFLVDYIEQQKNTKNKPLVITHSGIGRTFIELELLAKNINLSGNLPSAETIPNLTWELYKETKEFHPNTDFGSLINVSTENLSTPVMIELLRKASTTLAMGRSSVLAVLEQS